LLGPGEKCSAPRPGKLNKLKEKIEWGHGGGQVGPKQLHGRYTQSDNEK